MRYLKYDKWLYGFIAGLVIPFIGYALLLMIVEAINQGSRIGINTSTVMLLAICINIFTVAIANKHHLGNFIRGAVSATLIYAILWVLHFYNII